MAVAELVPTVKAVPVFAPPCNPSAGTNRGEARKLPPMQSDNFGVRGGRTHGELKPPPESSYASALGNLRSERDWSSEDDESLEDYPLLDMTLCRLESDHALLSGHNTLMGDGSGCVGTDDVDDRKPPLLRWSWPVPILVEGTTRTTETVGCQVRRIEEGGINDCLAY
jgi:hypothetical protein